MRGAANTTEIVGNVFYGIVALSAVLLVGITATMVYFAIRYNRKRTDRVSNIEGHLGLEIAWTVIPTLIVLVIFYYGFEGYMKTRRGPSDSLVVSVTGRMWQWDYRYPNGAKSTEMRLPVGQPVRAEMESADVLHSFFIPAFRIKQDVLPGRKTHIYFTPQKVGTYDIFCAEYCGTMHSQMLSRVIVMPRDRFLAWYNASKAAPQPVVAQADAPAASAGTLPGTNPAADAAGGAQPASSQSARTQPPATGAAPAPRSAGAAPKAGAGAPGQGASLLSQKGCTACHSIDGSKTLGPTFKGLYGSSVTVIADGKERTLTVDDAYLTRSISQPQAEIVKGYQAVMPQLPLSESEIKALIAYIKSVK